MLASLAYYYANQIAKNAFTFSKVKTCHFWPLDKAILCYDTAYRTFLMHHHHHDKNEAATQFLWQCSSPSLSVEPPPSYGAQNTVNVVALLSCCCCSLPRFSATGIFASVSCVTLSSTDSTWVSEKNFKKIILGFGKVFHR